MDKIHTPVLVWSLGWHEATTLQTDALSTFDLPTSYLSFDDVLAWVNATQVPKARGLYKKRKTQISSDAVPPSSKYSRQHCMKPEPLHRKENRYFRLRRSIIIAIAAKPAGTNQAYVLD